MSYQKKGGAAGSLDGGGSSSISDILSQCMRLFRVLPGPRYLVPFLYNLMSTSPGSHKLNLEKRVPGKNFKQAHTIFYHRAAVKIK